MGQKDILEEAKEYFDLFHKDKRTYKKKVNHLSDLFKLKCENRFRSDYLPTYLVGDYKDKKNHKYILFGINPGFSEKQNKIEEGWKKASWPDYINFVRNFFTLFKYCNMESKYYKRLANLFSGLDDNIALKDYTEIYDYYQKHIINLELIPYHSSKISIPANLKDEQRKYLEDRFNANINFVEKYLKKSNIKLMIFNGKSFDVLIIKNKIIEIEDMKRQKPYKDVNMYTFKINGIPCVLFDKFITQRGFGLSYEDIKNIGKDIKPYI